MDGRVMVVFVHGLGGIADQWAPIRSAMASDLPGLAVDLAGHGQRRADPGPVHGGAVCR
jgi:pimeloyl-ACP methyl ester carboxylesterase